MRKVLLVSNMYPSEDQIIYGVFIRNVENALQESGCHVTRRVITGRGHTVSEKLKKYIKFYWELLKIDLSKFDIVDISYPSHSFLPFFLKRAGKTKLIVRLHGHDLVAAEKETLSFRLFRWITLQACRRADGVVVPSAFFERELLYHASDIKTPIIALPSGSIDSSVFRPMPEIAASNGEVCFGYVGRLDQRKGIDLFLHAFARLRGNCRAIIVGDGPFRAQLEQLIQKLELEGRCKLVGPVAYQDLPAFYNQFDLFVFPTLYRESFGSVMLESMACGVPVLASDHGAPADFIADGMDGFKFQPGNIDHLAEIMNDFLVMPVFQRNILRQNAIAKAKEYTSQAVTGKYLSFIKQIDI